MSDALPSETDIREDTSAACPTAVGARLGEKAAPLSHAIEHTAAAAASRPGVRRQLDCGVAASDNRGRRDLPEAHLRSTRCPSLVEGDAMRARTAAACAGNSGNVDRTGEATARTRGSGSIRTEDSDRPSGCCPEMGCVARGFTPTLPTARETGCSAAADRAPEGSIGRLQTSRCVARTPLHDIRQPFGGPCHRFLSEYYRKAHFYRTPCTR